jgi:hypothetical protein
MLCHLIAPSSLARGSQLPQLNELHPWDSSTIDNDYPQTAQLLLFFAGRTIHRTKLLPHTHSLSP